jgi:tetratricopeptide (TPR) repeat protein
MTPSNPQYPSSPVTKGPEPDSSSVDPEPRAIEASPLWGRDDLLSQLDGCWDTARRGRPLVVRLLGDPGVGKTSLIRAFVDRQPDAKVVTVNATPDLAHASYRFLDAIATAWHAEQADFGQDATAVWHLLGRTSETTPSAAAVSGVSKATWFMAFRALTCWLIHRIDAQPCILVLEDLHWVDQGSLEFLEYWLNDLGASTNRSFMLLLSERTGGGYHLRANGLGNVNLPVLPLDEEQALRMASHRLGFEGESLPEPMRAEVQEILARANGNPFLLTELLDRRSESGEIPRSIRESAQARYQELNPSAQSLLGLLAVAGYHLDSMLLDAFSSGNSRTVLELVNAGFLQLEGAGYRFCHSLTQQAVYEAMDPDLRRQRHAKIAAFMQERSSRYPAYTASEAARHLFGAGRTKEARSMLLEAADYALQRYDLREGRELLSRALDLFAPREAEYASVAIRLAEVELARADGQEARRLLLALGGPAVPGWTLAMVKVHERMGDYEAAGDLLREALVSVQPMPERAALELALAQLELRQGNYTACEQRAASLLNKGLPKPEMALACSLIGISCYRLGRYDEALRFHLRALAKREACQDLAGVASTYNNLGSLYYDQGKWKEAAQAYQRGKLLAERIGEAWLASSFDNNLGNLALNQGKWDDAERCYRSSLAIKEKLGERAGIAIARCNLGNALGRMGRYDEAREILREAIALMEQIGDREVLADLYAHLGMIEVEAEANDDAWASLLRAIELGTELNRAVPMGIAYRGQSLILMRRGDPVRAFDLVQSSLNLLEGAFASLEHARSLSQAALIADRLGNQARASAYRLCAVDAFEKLGANVDLARLKESA